MQIQAFFICHQHGNSACICEFLGGFTGCSLDDQPNGWGIKLGYLLNHLQVDNLHRTSECTLEKWNASTNHHFLGVACGKMKRIYKPPVFSEFPCWLSEVSVFTVISLWHQSKLHALQGKSVKIHPYILASSLIPHKMGPIQNMIWTNLVPYIMSCIFGQPLPMAQGQEKSNSRFQRCKFTRNYTPKTNMFSKNWWLVQMIHFKMVRFFWWYIPQAPCMVYLPLA